MQPQQDLFGAAPTDPRFDQDALGFLIAFARRTTGSFSAEHVTLAAIDAGIAPADFKWPHLATPPRGDMHDASNIQELLDQKRALAAQLAGIEMRICLALGDRDGAYRHMKEMEVQIHACMAAREVSQE